MLHHLPKRRETDAHIVRAADKASGFFRGRLALPLLSLISFVESALMIPIITDPFLVAYIINNRARAVVATLVTTTASIVGGVCAYVLAYVAFAYVAQNFLSESSVATLQNLSLTLEEGTFIITLIGAITPVPYTLVAMAVGFAQANIWIFLAASLLGRGARYALVAFLTWKFGDTALAHARRHATIATVAVLLLGGALFVYKTTG